MAERGGRDFGDHAKLRPSTKLMFLSGQMRDVTSREASRMEHRAYRNPFAPGRTCVQGTRDLGCGSKLATPGSWFRTREKETAWPVYVNLTTFDELLFVRVSTLPNAFWARTSTSKLVGQPIASV